MLLGAAYLRTNLTLRQLIPPLGVAKSATSRAAQKFRNSTSQQVVFDADTPLVFAVGRVLPGNRNDCKAWELADAKDTVGKAAVMDDIVISRRVPSQPGSSVWPFSRLCGITRPGALLAAICETRRFGPVECFECIRGDEGTYLKPNTINNGRTKAPTDLLHTYNEYRSHTTPGGQPPINRVNNCRSTRLGSVLKRILPRVGKMRM
ncbi:hypothetical protein ACIPJS_39025 [Streptomyces sp. NPDC086783]|uniref:hypothetical protein n=1 Tax=Streptomyces sp. NPDC086783 TaxID=3365758 RepID=UPI0037FEE86B